MSGAWRPFGSWTLGREDAATVVTGAQQEEESGRDEAVLRKL